MMKARAIFPVLLFSALLSSCDKPATQDQPAADQSAQSPDSQSPDSQSPDPNTNAPAADGIELFNGKDLTGWTQRNGTATYEVKDGALVGTTAEGSPNSFLCSDKEFGDFELTFEVKVDDRLNSGVQVRSKTINGPQGRVNGPQVEIEASGENGAEAGYIYGEALSTGWLTPKEELKPHKHFKDGEWNSYRIVAKGPRIQVWINGEQISDLTDEERYESHPKGFLGLQVHSIGKGQGPWSVAWKNIKIKEL